MSRARTACLSPKPPPPHGSNSTSGNRAFRAPPSLRGNPPPRKWDTQAAGKPKSLQNVLMADREGSKFQNGGRGHPKSRNEGHLVPRCALFNPQGLHGRLWMACGLHSTLAPKELCSRGVKMELRAQALGIPRGQRCDGRGIKGRGRGSRGSRGREWTRAD